MTRKHVVLWAAGVMGALAPPAGASGGGSFGGTEVPFKPRVRALTCQDGASSSCARGAVLTVAGSHLRQTRAIVFMGARGVRDDRRSSPTTRADDRVTVVVPASAHSGRVRVVAAGAPAVGPRLRVRRAIARGADDPGVVYVDSRAGARMAVTGSPGGTVPVDVVRDDGSVVAQVMAPIGPDGSGTALWRGMIGRVPALAGAYVLRPSGGAQAAQSAQPGFQLYDHVFPIRGRHDLGQTRTNNFGGGRNHEGQDMFAACGTPLVAARGGTVKIARREARAGNYVVIQRQDGGSEVYMHLRSLPLVTAGERVYTGDPLGEVGDSGDAVGCHLHFEEWTAPGWYEGGRPYDPLPDLRRWDAWS